MVARSARRPGFAAGAHLPDPGGIDRFGPGSATIPALSELRSGHFHRLRLQSPAQRSLSPRSHWLITSSPLPGSRLFTTTVCMYGIQLSGRQMLLGTYCVAMERYQFPATGGLLSSINCCPIATLIRLRAWLPDVGEPTVRSGPYHISAGEGPPDR
jgi:hypothetical protein